MIILTRQAGNANFEALHPRVNCSLITPRKKKESLSLPSPQGMLPLSYADKTAHKVRAL
jgi:hypothetical protein